METTYGYVRVSSPDQNEYRQLSAMSEFGVSKTNIFLDKQSGKDFNRPAYRRLRNLIKPGDMLVVKSIDRLGRDYEEILAEWRFLTKETQVTIIVLDMPLLNVQKNEHGITGTLIADIVLQILSYVAQIEREFICMRQTEGIAAAKAKGVKFGRKPLQRPEKFDEIRERWLKNEISARKAAKELNVAHRTFLNWVKET